MRTSEASPRVALYARVSTADQNAALQLDALRSAAEQRGWDVVAEHVDHASGARASRPGLDEIRALARSGRLDLIAVWRLDRLARSVRNFVDLAEELRANRVALVSLREGLDFTTAVGRTFAQLLAVLAELEREVIRERVSAGIAAARRRGKRIGRRPRQIDLDRALELRAQGASVRAVAAELGLPRSVVHRALSAAPGGACKVCGTPVLLDLHGRPRWHPAQGAGAPCAGVGQ